MTRRRGRRSREDEGRSRADSVRRDDGAADDPLVALLVTMGGATGVIKVSY